MSKKNWGESFLKSGLPLEHLTFVTLRSLGLQCRSTIEFQRPDRDGKLEWFELDMSASIFGKLDTELSFLIECKYHDEERFWFFLPRDDGYAGWMFDDAVLNFAPLQALKEPRKNTFLSLAPRAVGGIVISEKGEKQDNMAYKAIKQLAEGFLPCCLQGPFGYNLDYHNSYVPEVDYLPTGYCDYSYDSDKRKNVSVEARSLVAACDTERSRAIGGR